MKRKKLDEIATEDLHKSVKTVKTITGLLLGELIVLLILSLYITINKGFTALLIIPFALFPIVIVNYISMINLKNEIKLRAGNQPGI